MLSRPMKVLTWLFIALLVYVGVLAAGFIGWLIWRLVAPRSWYFYNMTTWSGKLGSTYVRGFFKRYGETDATEMLVKNVTVQLGKIHARLAVGVEEEQLEKVRSKLDTLMRNVIDALRTLHLDEKVFPILASVFTIFSRVQGQAVRKTMELREAGIVVGSAPSIAVANPIVPTMTWILEELLKCSPTEADLQGALGMLRQLGRKDPTQGAFFTGLADILEHGDRGEPRSDVQQ